MMNELIKWSDLISRGLLFAKQGLVVCSTVSERNLLADVATLMDKHKSCKRVDELRKIVADGLRSNGYNTSVCKSRWEKSASFPAGNFTACITNNNFTTCSLCLCYLLMLLYDFKYILVSVLLILFHNCNM